MQASIHPEAAQFGELLRFWRCAFGQNQEELAHGIDVSTRHLSFLETGRSHPSRALIEKIIAHFGLRARDAGNLLLAAGWLPHSEAVDLNSPGQEELRSGVVATLRSLDPFPAVAIDPCANVKLFNRAWLYMHQRLFGEAVLGAQINTIRLLVAENGWRRYLADWADQVCFYLLILKQEAILRNSREAADLLEDILCTPGIPPDWAARGARVHADGHNHRYVRRTARGERAYINVHHTVGSTTFVSEPRLIIHAILPEDGVADVTPEQLDSVGLRHPLLAG
ncbi:MAG TPA: helix-turn-helix domain-containing protein [Povalibacter sp.]|uniref:MmyB family transcriptional regulator n=1 Tax=Povalibacter sp. TaxID=1962978 RepID=UPI002CE5EACF|nr:helix-turn-helix domain-containing protein [Povalibacter sp.]HMN46431.1 helix-turn-helix domain-containing protein [Povalibacter sp.]